ncbi:MAG: flagellar FlbD family protein [Chloroflexi bacterium]|nr:flagellar FlbD family protein [Chloroflexota bacterium]
MITVTRLNDTRFVLNAEQIKTVESTPDTIITLLTGEKLMVKESPEFSFVLEQHLPVIMSQSGYFVAVNGTLVEILSHGRCHAVATTTMAA